MGIGLRIGMRIGTKIGLAIGDPGGSTADILIGLVGDSNSNGKGDPSKGDSAYKIATPNTGVLYNGRAAAGAGVDPPAWSNFDTDLVMRSLAPRTVGGLFGAEITLGSTLQGAVARPAIAQMGIDGSLLDTNWKPSSTFMLVSTGKNLFATMIARMQSFGSSLGTPISGMTVSLGTNDASLTGPANAFQANMTAFIAGVRAVFGATFPIAWIKTNVGTTGGFVTTVRAAQVAVAALDPFLFLIDNDDCLLIADNLHYTAESYLVIGDRCARALLDARGFARRAVTTPTLIGWGPAAFGSGNISPKSSADARDGDLEQLVIQTGVLNGSLIDVPTGWTQQGVLTVTGASGVFDNFAFFTRPIDAAMLAANNNHTAPTSITAHDNRNWAKTFMWRGPNLNPTIDNVALFASNAIASTMTIPTMSTLTANCGVAVFSCGWFGSSIRSQVLTNTKLAGFVELQDGADPMPTSDALGATVNYGTLAAAGAVGSTVATITGGTIIGFGITVAVKP